jgi:hypothetical protein
MGFDTAPQFASRDGCVYVFNHVNGQWYKFCPASSLPSDVKKQISDLKEQANELPDSLP